MKQTHTINLGGQVYHIDEDAYKRLKQYLDKLESQFKNEPEVAEIMRDIEARLSELFNERLKYAREVITMADVDEAIGILGEPEVITESTSGYSGSGRSRTNYRRMYRDPDNRIIAGVCSGLGSYFHLDPAIIRIVFVAVFFLGGSGLLIYLILWLVLPEAVTTAQKLEMRGEPVTIENIKNFFSREFENVKQNFKK